MPPAAAPGVPVRRGGDGALAPREFLLQRHLLDRADRRGRFHRRLPRWRVTGFRRQAVFLESSTPVAAGPGADAAGRRPRPRPSAAAITTSQASSPYRAHEVYLFSQALARRAPSPGSTIRVFSGTMTSRLRSSPRPQHPSHHLVTRRPAAASAKSTLRAQHRGPGRPRQYRAARQCRGLAGWRRHPPCCRACPTSSRDVLAPGSDGTRAMGHAAGCANTHR